MSSGGAYGVAVAMNDMKKARELRKEKMDGTREALLTRRRHAENEEEPATERAELLETLKFPYHYQHLCNIL
jgi:hypothetical protein